MAYASNLLIKSRYILLFFVAFIAIGSVFMTESYAADPICIPAACPHDYVPNTECILQQIMDPSSSEARNCCENKCKDGVSDVDAPSQFTELVTMFGQTISVKDDHRVAALVNLVMTSVLGLISLYTIVYGIYLAGYKRPKTITPDEIGQINRTLTYMVLGFILAWSFIFIMQFISTMLGIGSLDQLVLIGDSTYEAPTTIVIE